MGTILELLQEALRNHGQPEIGTSVTRAHTGRVSESFTAEQQMCELLINRWLDDASDDPLSVGRQLVKELISELPRCGAPPTYRARRFPATAHPTDPLEFGPSPTLAAGRYNRARQSALYLGMDPRGLVAEMAQFTKPGEHFYYAQYLPIPSLSLVDLTAPSIHTALHLAFDRAERLDLDHEAAQRLADVLRELRIDGIIVPGVRGDITHHYSNVVIFNCCHWSKWVDTNCPPKHLLSCSTE